MDTKATIYAITEGSRLDRSIDPGSGVVGVPRPGGILLYFEGNRLGASNLHEWLERVECAAGRLFANYPTIAKCFVPDGMLADAGLVVVGSIDARSYRISFRAPAPAADYAERYVPRS